MTPEVADRSERAVLGAVLLAPERLPEVAGALAPEDFANVRHGAIFGAVLALQGAGRAVDVRTVEAELDRSGKLAEAGGLAYLSGLDIDLPDIDHLPDYTADVAEAARRRRIAEAARLVSTNPSDTEAADRLRDLIDAAEPSGEPLARTAAEVLATGTNLPAPLLRFLAWPGRSTLLVAPPKLGKSTLATFGAACTSKGRAFLDAPTMTGPVLIASEECPDDIARRLRDMGADLDVVSILQWKTDPVAEIRAACADSDPVLIIVDSLADVAQTVAPESGSASAWSKVMRPLVRIARDTGAAILILHHSRREDGEFRDSGEIAAAVDVIATMKDAGGTRRRIEYRGRYGRGEFTIRLAGGRFDLDGDDGGDTDERQAAILGHVQRNPGCSQRSIIEAVQGRTDALRQDLASLIADGRIDEAGSPARREYRAAKSVSRGSRRETVRETVSDESVSTVSDLMGIGDSGNGKRSGKRSVSTVGGPMVPTGNAGPDDGNQKGKE